LWEECVVKTAITGGTVVTASETYTADVLIEGERIIAVGEGLAAGADTVIDATGKLVLPGGIDVHTHLDMPFGGTTSCDDFTTGHVAALHGGTTTHIDFVSQTRGNSLQDALDLWRSKANGKAVADYGFHMIVTDARPEVIDEMESMVEQGVTSFKLFLAYPGVLMVDDDTLHAVMEKAAKLDALVMMHCENGQVIDRLVQRAIAEKNLSPGWHWRTRPSVLEGESTQRAIALSKLTGAALYVVHVTCEEAASAIGRARLEGQRVWGETCPQYLYLSRDDLDKPNFEGAKYVCSPPLRTESDQEYLWNAIVSDALSAVSTDHCPFNFKDQKALGKDDFSKVPNGIPGIEERMAVMSTGVANGRLDWNRLVDLTSTAPAKLFGMYPRKGTISAGADADIVVWDPNEKWTMSIGEMHGGIDYTCFEGFEATGRATHVLSRGALVVDGGNATNEMTAGRGKYVHRDTFGLQSPWESGAGTGASKVAASV
jgi:dihydropyrimidinase